MAWARLHRWLSCTNPPDCCLLRARTYSDRDCCWVEAGSWRRHPLQPALAMLLPPCPAAEEVLLDENEEAKKHKFYMVGGFEESPDHRLGR